jgi:hypothetical protein
MKIYAIIAAFAAAGLLPSLAFAAEVQCEDSVKTLQDTIKTVAPKADVMANVQVLLDKAIERCKAEDDKRSNGFAADAMKLMGK